MNATELHSIVKDVPMEALPECVTGWIRGLYVEVRANPDDGRPHAIHAQMFPDDAELLFVGSMAKWLLLHPKYIGAPLRLWRCGDGHWHFGSEEFFEESPVRALAAACKAVGGKDGEQCNG